MNNHRKPSKTLLRNVVWTHCESGPLDLHPTATEHCSGYLDASMDFEAQSFHPAPKFDEITSSWSPAYARQETRGVSEIGADLIALTLGDVSTAQVYRWLVAKDLTGLVWPNNANTYSRPSCCIVLLLDSTVNQHDYKRIWLKLAREVFGNVTDSAQADFRYRFEYPRTSSNESRLLRHDAEALPTYYGLAPNAISAGPTVATAQQAPATP